MTPRKARYDYSKSFFNTLLTIKLTGSAPPRTPNKKFKPRRRRVRVERRVGRHVAQGRDSTTIDW